MDDSSNKLGPTSAIVTLGQDEKEIRRQQKQNKENKEIPAVESWKKL